jgi:MoaA/NifB/PqqE/SkfB family radical SAM enzyme
MEMAALVRYLRDGWARELWRSRSAPSYIAGAPATISVELTNVCQLRCPHCDAQHPAIRGPAGYMSDATFARLVAQLRQMPVRNLRIIGGGEPLLHPNVAAWLPQLRGLASLTTLTTNGQRLTEEITLAAIQTLDVIEVSVASDNAAGFERSRTGGDFEKVLRNLERFRVLRDRRKSRTLVHVRVMLRPSEVPTTDRLLAFWRSHGDVVSSQRLQDYFGEEGDVFERGTVEDYPPCMIPFRVLGIGWDGVVPLCRTSAFQTGSPQGLVLGNINDTTLSELWRSDLLRQYQDAHVRRDPTNMPICHKCPDPQRPGIGKVFDTNAHITRAARPESFVPIRTLVRRRRAV